MANNLCSALIGAVIGSLLGGLIVFNTTNHFFQQDIALKFTQDYYLPLLSATADFNRTFRKTKVKDTKFEHPVFSSKEMKKLDTFRVQEALEKMVNSGALKVFRDLEISKNFNDDDQAFKLMDESFRLGKMYETTKNEYYYDQQRKSIHELYEVLYTRRKGKKVITDPKFLRIGPNDFGTWVSKFLKLEPASKPTPDTNKDFSKYSFKKHILKEHNGASGLIMTKPNTFWTVGDKYLGTLTKLEINRGQVVIFKSLNVRFPEAIKNTLHQDLPNFDFENLDLEGITYDIRKNVFYIVSEKNRTILTISEEKNGEVLSYFPVKGKDSEPGKGLEGITFDNENKIIFVVEEGPMFGNKKVHRYNSKGNLLGNEIKINAQHRITGLTYNPKSNSFLALNTFSSKKEKHHKIIEFFITGGAVSEKVDFIKHYPNFSEDFGNNMTNYEGIDIDENGNLYVINDSMEGDKTHLLVISKN